MTTPNNSSELNTGSPVNTAGGAFVDGNVNANEFVGRDKTVYNISDDDAHDVRGLPNPYLGLRSFTYDDRASFAGREREVAATVAQLTEPGAEVPLLYVTGASGSGKSSFAQAGLLPALEAHYAKRGQHVRGVVFTPSQRPMARLKDALAQVDSPDPRGLSVTVLIIDQFEELFTQSDRAERDSLFAWLQALPPFAYGRMHVIATIRSDYLNELYGVQPLWDAAMQHRAELRAMNVDELKAAIQRPLQARFPSGEKRFEPALADALAKDSAENATFLPLLQMTLEEIWKKGKLERAGYGTLTDAIRQRADQVYEFEDYDDPHPSRPRSKAVCTAVMDIFLDLVNVSLDDDDRRDVRISRAKDDLANGGRSKLIDDLAQARLLSVTKPGQAETVNIIHETLIGNWTRLSDAIRERRQHLQQRARFEQQVGDWIDHGKSDDYLLTGVYLAQAHELEQTSDISTRTKFAQDILRGSLQKERGETQRKQLLEKQARRRLEFLVVLLGALLVVSVAIIFYPHILGAIAASKSQLIPVQAGTALIGNDAADALNNEADIREGPQRVFDLGRFSIEQYEVSNEQYRLCLYANRCSMPTDPSNLDAESKLAQPVVGVTAIQAAEYCSWIGRRLPTELEWERAARGSEGWLWPWGNEPPTTRHANIAFAAARSKGLDIVTSHPAGNTPDQIANLIGNAEEWTASFYQESYANYDESEVWNGNRSADLYQKELMTRGGSWVDSDTDVRTTRRSFAPAVQSSTNLGFRCALG